MPIHIIAENSLPVVGQVAPIPLEGRRYEVYTQDFCKKETWYQDSARVTNETLTDVGYGYLFIPAVSRYWVDVTHGKLFRERDLRSTYAPVIKVDDVIQAEHSPGTEDGDYAIDYTTGAVQFKEPQTNKIVTATYSYVQTSLFCARPPSGYRWIINDIKVLYSIDIGMKDTIIFQLWGNIGEGMQPLSSPEYYQTLNDLLKDASRVEYGIPIATGGGDNWRMPDVEQVVLHYDYEGRAATTLQSAYSMEIRCWLENNIPFDGESGSATFFGRKELE